MDIKNDALALHKTSKGKIEVTPRVSVTTRDELSLAYTPGVAFPCLEIEKDKNLSYVYTRRHNLVLVVTDGTAVLGLGDIGPEAGMPVMEGKCVLFKAFGDVDAFPLCIRSKDVTEIVNTISLIAGSFGGINLEDISAPRCFEIEKQLKEKCDIPVFHDDQHGTAIVVGAALINALKLANKKLEDVKIVINGAGAAGTAITTFLLELGVKNVIVCDKQGILSREDSTLSKSHHELAQITNPHSQKGSLKDALIKADVFIGVSAPNIVTEEMISSMNDSPICFPLANPIPEISREQAIKAGAFIVGTGSSANPNQINNVLAFPGIFRGALDCRSKDINIEMMKAASHAIANTVPAEKLSPEYIIPYAFDKQVHENVAKAVMAASIATNQARI